MYFSSCYIVLVSYYDYINVHFAALPEGNSLHTNTFATQKTKELYAQTVHSYNTYAVGGGVGGTVQLDRIADKLDELTRVTEGSKIDEGEFADKLGTAMEKVNIKAEAVISSRRVAAEIASDMDKEQGETLALRDRGVI